MTRTKMAGPALPVSPAGEGRAAGYGSTGIATGPGAAGVRKEIRDTAVIAALNLQWIRRLPLLFAGYSLMIPVALAFVFITISGGSDTDYIVIGTVVFAVVQPTFLGMAKGLSSDKFSGMLTYYKLLPISPLALSLGVSLSSLALGAPSLILFVALGFHYGALVSVTVGKLLILIFTSVLAWVLFSGLGYAVAMSISRLKQAQTTVDLVWAVLVFVSPIYYPLSLIRSPWVYLYYLNPVTYYSSVVRYCLASTGSPVTVLLDLIVLAVVSVGLMAVMFRGWKWIEE